MHESIKGKVVVISGGGRGLGRAMALGLVEAGARVLLTAAREGQELKQTAKDCQSIGGQDCVLQIQADVSSADDCQRVMESGFKKWGHLHMLINNAGRGMSYADSNFVKARPPFWKIETKIWKMIVDTNLNGIFNMSKAAAPYFIKEGWGRIVNISTSLITMQRRGYSPYGSTKWAVEGLTMIMAQDFEDTAITANILIPGGATDTAMIPGNVGDKSRTGADGNLFEPEIMVPPAQYLASSLSDNKSGFRYVAKLWDSSLAPEEAAEKTRFPIKRERKY